jgi:hypothetical protein
MTGNLRLKAEGPEDLEVISAALQDAVLQIGDAVYDARSRRFTAVVNRFRWETAGGRGPYERVRAALSFESVTGVRSARVARADSSAVASLLSLAFDADDEPPGGALRLVLAGGGEIRLDIECVDGLLLDMGAPWPTPRKPFHGIST